MKSHKTLQYEHSFQVLFKTHTHTYTHTHETEHVKLQANMKEGYFNKNGYVAKICLVANS